MNVLDASALLALLYREPGQEIVAQKLSGSCISTVNLAEVLSRFTRESQDHRSVQASLSSLGLEVVPFSSEQAAIAAELLPLTKEYGLSLGDRACLALARDRRCGALTADRIWADLEVDVSIELIR